MNKVVLMGRLKARRFQNRIERIIIMKDRLENQPDQTDS